MIDGDRAFHQLMKSHGQVQGLELSSADLKFGNHRSCTVMTKGLNRGTAHLITHEVKTDGEET
jgi:hypothetical protein